MKKSQEQIMETIIVWIIFGGLMCVVAAEVIAEIKLVLTNLNII